MTGIIAAMKVELDGIKARLENAAEAGISGVTYYTGTISGEEVVCAVCGVGKVNAAVCTQSMILTWHPDRVINTGVGGALDPKLRVCDVVCGTYAVQHDFDTTLLGDAPGFVSTVNVIKFPLDEALSEGLCAAMRDVGVSPVKAAIATGDQFISSAEAKERIKSQFGCGVCEMEGAAIAHVCYLNRTPCAVLRAISDGADEGAPMSFDEFAAMAAQRSVNVLLRFIENLNA